MVTFTLKHAIAASTHGCETTLPAGTRVGWTDELAVSQCGTLRQCVIANGKRFLVDEAALTAMLARIK